MCECTCVCCHKVKTNPLANELNKYSDKLRYGKTVILICFFFFFKKNLISTHILGELLRQSSGSFLNIHNSQPLRTLHCSANRVL